MKRKRRTRWMVQERESKMKMSTTPFLPDDLMIFLVLPIKTLLKINCVSKSWKKIINCAQFVEAYNNKAQACAISLRPIQYDRLLDPSFNIEIELSKLESFSIFPLGANIINCLEIEHGKCEVIDYNISCLGSIVAICNGLILISSTFQNPRLISNNVSGVLTFDRGRLIIMNPMTRKFLGFPLGTLPSYRVHNESYGLMFSHLEGVYKAVHLFKDELGCIACEVWSTDTRYWRAIDGPSQTVITLSQFEIPIWACGALHWLPSEYYYHLKDWFLSMGADDERFFVTKLPMSLGKDGWSFELSEEFGSAPYRGLDSQGIRRW